MNVGLPATTELKAKCSGKLNDRNFFLLLFRYVVGVGRGGWCELEETEQVLPLSKLTEFMKQMDTAHINAK